jgi:hypothetical protein
MDGRRREAARQDARLVPDHRDAHVAQQHVTLRAVAGELPPGAMASAGATPHVLQDALTPAYQPGTNSRQVEWGNLDGRRGKGVDVR